MTSSDPDPNRSGSGDADGDARAEPTSLVLVARIAESLPLLDERELNALADAVESLTDAIGLRLDWLDSDPVVEPGDSR